MTADAETVSVRDRLPRTASPPSRGAAVTTGLAGLGPAIVASVTAAHDGRLEIADPDTGQGLAVTIHLPTPTAGA